MCSSDLFDNEKLNAIYILNDNEKEITHEFHYNNNEYTTIGYSNKIQHSKIICTYNDQNDLIKSSTFFWETNNKYWNLDYIIEYSYDYNHITSNKFIETNINTISVNNNSLIIQTQKTNTNYFITSINGQLIKKGQLNYGINQILLQKGIYLLNCDNKIHKIMIK